jgi:transcriptional regulator with XRE-family HTH domain
MQRITRLKFWRLQLGLTQTQAARRLAMGESSLAMLESGRLQPTRHQVALLREYFGSAAESLFDAVQERIEVEP